MYPLLLFPVNGGVDPISSENKVAGSHRTSGNTSPWCTARTAAKAQGASHKGKEVHTEIHALFLEVRREKTPSFCQTLLLCIHVLH